MGYPIPEEKIEEIRQSINLVELVQEYVALKRTGKNFVGKCPFHVEKTPSFTVSPEKQIYHCFGCGAGGNAFTFIMQQENMTFPEAARFLARKAGIHLPEKELTVQQKKILHEKDTLHEINKAAADFFHQQLYSSCGKNALRYLAKRGISKEMADIFQLGYAPDSSQELIDFLLKEKKYCPSFLKKTGLFIDSSYGNEVRCRFRGRLIFPIWDSRGRVIGFGGRKLGEGEPKYLNSPETPLFKKSEVLYGLHLALKEMRNQGKALVVEGYIDVISAYSFGFKNTVASLGTSFTEKQADLLRLRTEEVVIAYDADASGKIATLRGMKILKDRGLNVKVASLPKGFDPDDYLRQNGAAAFHDILEKSSTFLDYQLDAAKWGLDLATREGRLNYWRKAKPILLDLNDLVEREDYLKKVASVLKVPPDVVRKELVKNRGQKNKKVVTRAKSPAVKNNLLLKAQKELLQILMVYPDTIKELRPDLKEDYFTHTDYRLIMAHILKIYDKKNKIEIAELYQVFSDENIHKLISELSFGKKEEYEGKVQKIACDCLYKLKAHHVATERRVIEKKLGEAESRGDTGLIDNLLKKWLDLKNLEKSAYRSGEGERYHG